MLLSPFLGETLAISWKLEFHWRWRFFNFFKSCMDIQSSVILNDCYKSHMLCLAIKLPFLDETLAISWKLEFHWRWRFFNFFKSCMDIQSSVILNDCYKSHMLCLAIKLPFLGDALKISWKLEFLWRWRFFNSDISNL